MHKYKSKRKYILLFKSVKALGLIKGVLFWTKTMILKKSKLSISGWKHPIYLRPGSYDLDVLLQFMADKQYEMEYPDKIRVILDAGANIGLASAYFANKFPEAKIIAIEPDSDNYQQLLRNIKHYSNVVPIKAGLWKNNTNLKIYDPGFGEWSFMVEETESTEGSLPARTVDDICREYSISSIDIFKIDIEGSEKEVFESENGNWLHLVRMLIVEVHDQMKAGTANAVIHAVKNKDFNFYIKDENLVFVFK
ncbi:MAG: FkbM family methyltransferase [Saprospiraceae bacterium]|nr:FkbM family methyltransferase [Saprospiraceae bacterium]